MAQVRTWQIFSQQTIMVLGGIKIRNLSTVAISTEEEGINQLFIGDTNRAIAETPMNQASTRSHCIFTIHLEIMTPGEPLVKRSKAWVKLFEGQMAKWPYFAKYFSEWFLIRTKVTSRRFGRIGKNWKSWCHGTNCYGRKIYQFITSLSRTGNQIWLLKWGASSRWSFGTDFAWDSIGGTTLECNIWSRVEPH